MFVAIASMGVMANAQSVEELQVKAAQIQEQLDNYDDGIAKKWEFRFDGAYENNFVGTDNKAFTHKEEGAYLNLGAGYNFNSNFYAGIATGYIYGVGDCQMKNGNQFIPALADLTYRWNGKGEKWSFFIQGRGGYLFSIKGDEKTRTGENYEYPNGLYVDIQPGVYYRVNRAMDIKLSVGYAHMCPSDDTPDMSHATNMMVVKLGMNFRKAPKGPKRSELLAESALLAEQIEAARLAAEEAARQAALKAAQEEAARLAAAEAAAKKAAEEEAARLAALEAAKHKELTLFYEIRLSDLTAEHNAQLDELVEWVNTRKIDKIEVKGYADRETGNPRLNVGYAKNRAEKVKKALIKKYKIDKNMIECSSYGDTVQPFGENIKNRCTIIVVNEVDE